MAHAALRSLALLLLAAPQGARAETSAWQAVALGVEHRTFAAPERSRLGDSTIHVVRIDPARAELVLLAVSEQGGALRTAGQWADEHRLVATINAGMFQTDYRKNVGHMSAERHVNNGGWRKDYHSLLAFGPRRPGLPGAILVNREGFERAKKDYRTLVQNLRLIGEGENRWSRQPKLWSEAAIASDDRGRILFVFCRSPYDMWTFNRMLLELPLGVVNAMHVEGGPEASLSLRGPARIDLSGSFETGFLEHDGEAAQWPLPNVIGVRPRAARR